MTTLKKSLPKPKILANHFDVTQFLFPSGMKRGTLPIRSNRNFRFYISQRKRKLRMISSFWRKNWAVLYVSDRQELEKVPQLVNVLGGRYHLVTAATELPSDVQSTTSDLMLKRPWRPWEYRMMSSNFCGLTQLVGMMLIYKVRVQCTVIMLLREGVTKLFQ